MTHRLPPRLFLGVLSLALLAGGLACGGGSSAKPPADGGADAAIPRIAWDWVGVVGTGQSLSVGGLGTPFIATKPVANTNNLKLSLGGATVPPFDPAADTLAMVPLVEPIRPTDPAYPSAYPGNIDGETPHTVMAAQITAMVQQAAAKDYITVHTVVGESGQPMSVINKTAVEVAPVMNVPGTSTGRAYAATLFEATAIARLAAAQSKTYGIGAIIITHGESDSGNPNYENDQVRLWSDYNVDLKAITHQTDGIPMLVSQQNSVPSNVGTSASTLAQWHVGVSHPGDLTCVGPKYQYPYLQDNTGSFIHLSAHGYELLGEKFGQVFYERVVLGHDWQPLQPTSAEVSGNVITVHFHVPVPPLVWDTTFPQPHLTGEWAMGRGFEVNAASAPQTIDAVEIVGTDTVKITCRNDLSGSAVVVGYAMTTDGMAMQVGDTRGTYRWGQLRDSDPFVGTATAVAQPNYCVAFSQTAPY